MSRKQIAFTLIELLVVIAIIGILSGLIVVTMSGVTQKAAIAKSQVFSNSLRNALMLNMIAEYKLDGDASDSWKNHTAGTVSLAVPRASCVQNSCYDFNTVNSYIQLPDAPDLRMSTGGTISVWIYPESTGGGGAKIVHKGTSATGVNGYNLRMDDTNRVIFDCNADLYVYSFNEIVWNQWSLISVTFNGLGRKIYINGLDRTASGGGVTGLPPDVAGNIRIGNAASNVTYTFDGYIDEVRFYDAVIPTSLIKDQYYAGLNNLLINGSISIEEYGKRVSNMAKI